ncbi:transferase family protein [Hypoxylon sp. FL1284]|nr:transferase family protein [Hypoxylon sp. FL1284]
MLRYFSVIPRFSTGYYNIHSDPSLLQYVFSIKFSRRIFPANGPQQKTVTKLSILDATVALFTPCSAIWLYNRADGADARDPVVFQRLEESLESVLDLYPHYSGQLRWASKELAQGDANPHYFGRPVVTYGAGEGPGVELIVAEDRRELSAIVPSHEERSTSKRVWRATDFPQHELQPDTQTAFSKFTEFEGLPGMAIQLTSFKCGGFAVAIKFTHCLSDATSLMQFAHTWAVHSRLLFGDSSKATARVIDEKPLFDPAQLDRYAHLICGGAVPDPDKVNKASALPIHRYDLWAADEITGARPARPSAADELGRVDLSASIPPPWSTWNVAAPVEHVQIRFKAATVANMKRAAAASLPDSLRGQRVSRLDAVLAHVWMLVNRARQHQDARHPVYLNITLGVRSRVAPPLPDAFAGSPLLLAHVAKAGCEAATSTIGAIAGSIRETMARFTPDAVAAFLHDAAFEVSPQRLWQAFLGRNHVIVTSWVRARAYEVDFCASRQLPRYVQGVMPRMDGVIQVMDVAGTDDFDVSVILERDAMQRFLRDPMLNAYGL